MSTGKIIDNIENLEFIENQRYTKAKYITKRNIVTALLVVILIILGVTVFVQTFHQNDSDQINTDNDKKYQRNFIQIKKEIPIATMYPEYSRQINGKQFQDKICQTKTDKKFTNFARGFAGSSYQQLFYDIRDLKCFYNKLRASDGNAKNTDLLLCSAYEDTSVTLNTVELSKLRDWNIKDGEALGRWENILNQFSLSLGNIENMEKSSTRRNYRRCIERVQNYTLSLQEDMAVIRKAYEKCSIKHNDTKIKIPDDIVKPYTEETLNELGITKEELAASIFKQMQIVLGVIKEDLDHRRKCVS